MDATVSSGTALKIAVDWEHQLAYSSSCRLKVWDLSRGTWVKTLEGPLTRCHCFAVDWPRCRSLHGTVRASNVDSVMQLWNLDEDALLRRYRGHTDRVSCLSVDWQEERVITGSHDKDLRL